MPDAKALREIADALLSFKAKADQAGSTTARSILIMSAEALRREADKAEQEAQVRTWQPMRKARQISEE